MSELDTTVAKLLLDTAESVSEAKNFILSELPDVVQQLLIWHMTQSVIQNIICLVLIGVIIYVFWRFSGIGEETGETRYGDMKYKPTLTHDTDGEMFPVMISVPLTVCACVFIAGFGLNLTWLQIWIAPKLYLIEYARGLL